MFNNSCSILIENAIHVLLFPFSGQINRVMNDKIILLLTTKYQLKKKKVFRNLCIKSEFVFEICS